MSKLRENIIEAWVKPDSINEIEIVTDDAMIKFADWFVKNNYEKQVGYYEASDLLQIFKDKYYDTKF